jgi:hypothetical protein
MGNNTEESGRSKVNVLERLNKITKAIEPTQPVLKPIFKPDTCRNMPDALTAVHI